MRARFWISIAAVATIAVGSVIAAAGIYLNDRGDFHRMQEEEAARAAHQLEAVAGLSIGKLSSASAFFEAERDLTGHEFDVIGRSLLSQGVLQGAAYIPRVTASRRERFERTHRIAIVQLAAAGPRRAGRRAVYFPVTYVAAPVAPRRGIGYDIGSDPTRSPFLRRARDSGKPAATSVIPLLVGGTGINVYRAIYRDGAPVATVAQRRRALLGFVAGAFQIDALTGTAVGAVPTDVATQLRVGGAIASGPPGSLGDAATAPVRIADRNWLLTVQDPGGPDLGLPLALGILGLSLAALLASLIVSWSRGERMRELEQQAGQDSLTGLGNRRRFEEDLAAAMARSRREGTTGALLMLDLDRFKRVNDSHGHPAGDRVIREVGEALRRRTRVSDSLARLGGDEFAVILPRCGREEAQTAAEAIAEEIRRQHPEDGSDPITVSIGIAIFGRDPRTSVATVVADADAAMYAAKDEGRDGVRIFEPAAAGQHGSPG
ncbi:MAG: diguanylate cyclase domain-containing protein [Solirubrobacterales bacterium]